MTGGSQLSLSRIPGLGLNTFKTRVTASNAHPGLPKLPPRAADKPGTWDMPPINLGHARPTIFLLFTVHLNFSDFIITQKMQGVELEMQGIAGDNAGKREGIFECVTKAQSRPKPGRQGRM